MLPTIEAYCLVVGGLVVLVAVPLYTLLFIVEQTVAFQHRRNSRQRLDW